MKASEHYTKSRMPYEKANERINDPDIVLTINEGLSFDKVCTTKESLLDFIRKFDDIKPWIQAEIAEEFVHDLTQDHLVEEFSWDDENEIIGRIPIPHDQEATICDYNPYWPQGYEFGFEKRTVTKLDPNDIRLVCDYQYPVLVHYSYTADFDRLGDFEYNNIMVIELPKLGMDKISIC